MKARLVSAILLALMPIFSAFAADGNAILEKIEKANSEYSTLKAEFSQTRKIKATGKETYLQGTLYFNREDKMSMLYSDKNESLVINGSKFYMKRGGRANTFNTENNALMRTLASTLLGCVAGHPATVAKAQKADIKVADSGKMYVVTITATKDSPKKYSRIELNYRKTDCVLVKMVMDEPSGVSNTYEMSNIRKNITVEPSSFAIPK
jgi:outer membrane lipoprotein-sorting protein